MNSALNLNLQQKSSERSIGIGRLVIALVMTGFFFFRIVRGGYVFGGAFWVHTFSLSLIFGYTIWILWMLTKDTVPSFVTYISLGVDIVVITAVLLVPPFGSQTNFPDFYHIASSSFFNLYFVTILFSTFRQNPLQSLWASVACASLYLAILLVGWENWDPQSTLLNEIVKMIILLITGTISARGARTLAKVQFRVTRAQKQLAEKDFRLGSIAANLPGGIFQFEWKPRIGPEILYLSLGMEDLTGFKNQSIIARPLEFIERFPEDQQEILIFNLMRAKKSRHRWSMEFPISKNPETWVRGIFSGQPTKGDEVLVHGLMLNVTNRKRAEIELREAWKTAQEANKAKTNFLANISHELRTPLNAILGFADILTHDFPGEEENRNLQNLRYSAETLLSIIEDILDFSRLEVGKLRVKNSYFKLNQLMENLYENFLSTAQGKGLKLTLNLGRSGDWELFGDMVRIRQILLNLLGNAFKFTQEGQVDLGYNFENMDGEERIVFSVKDSGIGIKNKDQELIFEEFQQVDGSKTRRYGGIGLGLSISRSLAWLMGGSLRVSSRHGSGAEFQLALPVKKTRIRDSQGKGVMNPMDDQNPMKILLVEDNAMNQDVQSRMLAKLGTRVTVASSGEECIELLHESDFDLIFMDWQMPDMDGLETTALIREQFPKPPKIIGLSGHALEEDQSLALDSGFDGFLTKPVRIADFRRVLSQFQKEK